MARVFSGISTPEVHNRPWYSRHGTKLAIGATALSFALPLSFQPMSENKRLVTETGPWVASGLAATEVAWVGGALIMLGAAGIRVRNPLKVRDSLDKVKEARGSKTLRTGFAIHMSGAVSQDAILAAAVLEMPKASWGLLSIPAYFAVASGLRATAMWPALKKVDGTEAQESGI